MRRKTAILSVAAVFAMATGVAAQAKPSFAGEWMIRGTDRPGRDLTVTQSPTALTVEYRAAGQAPAPAKLTYTLDGSVSRNLIAGPGGGAPTAQMSKAVWVGNALVVTTTTSAGEEKRTFSLEGGELVIDTSAPGRNGGSRTVTKTTYQRYERGHGG